MPTLTPGDGQDLLAAYKLAWERRDPDAAVALYAEGAEHRDDPFDAPLMGTNAIRALWNQRAASQANVEFDAERVWTAAAWVLSSYHAAYTERSNADRIRRRGFLAFELDDEKHILRARDWPVSRTVGTDATFRPEGTDGR
jgi:limonene-1,2-epoxide hydrolase